MKNFTFLLIFIIGVIAPLQSQNIQNTITYKPMMINNASQTMDSLFNKYEELSKQWDKNFILLIGLFSFLLIISISTIFIEIYNKIYGKKVYYDKS